MLIKEARRLQPLNMLTNKVASDRWAVLTPHMSLVVLQPGFVTSDPEKEFTHALFPISAVLALHPIVAEDYPLTVALIGREGMLGVWAFGNLHNTPQRSVVQFAGSALQIDVQILNAEFEASSNFRKMVFQYSISLLNCAIQTAACYRRHDPLQRLACTLVIAARRLQSDCIPVTHADLASILGLRRETISTTAMRLASKGVIKQNHGEIVILKANELRAVSCGCLGVFEALTFETDKPLPSVASMLSKGNT
jgi:hypothetical protein